VGQPMEDFSTQSQQLIKRRVRTQLTCSFGSTLTQHISSLWPLYLSVCPAEPRVAEAVEVPPRRAPGGPSWTAALPRRGGR
jgi:hypothetical protein